MNGLITDSQYAKLYKLGYRKGSLLIDDAIDWLRKRNVVIYNTAQPFANPCDHNRIHYSFSVKYCNTIHGWNCRELIGSSKWTSNIYEAKRIAINIAITWLNKKAKTVNINRGS